MKGNRTSNQAAIVIGGIGLVLVTIGLFIFISTFLSWTRSPLLPGTATGMPMGPGFGRAVLGVILTGAGSLMIKVALGLGIIGNAGRISSWFGKNVARPIQGDHPSKKTVVKVRCPKCQALCDEDARFCAQCGATM